MLKTIRSFVIAMTVFSLLMVSCQKENQVVPLEQNLSLSQKVTTDFNQAKQNWNTHAGKLVTLHSFKVSGRINSIADKQAMMGLIMGDDQMAAYGNILDESSMQLQTIGNLQKENSGTKETMRTWLNNQINPGDLVVDIMWQSQEKSFISKCIVHNDDIVWDNLLTSTIMMNLEPEKTLTTSKDIAPTDPGQSNLQNRATAVYVAWYKQTNSWVGNWIWGSKRGDMGETITIYCYSSGYVYNTDRADWANMALGSAKSESKVLVNTGTYGKIQYALGIATPFASVSFNSGTWKVEVSGIGSSMVRNGTHSLVPYKI